MPFLNPTTIAGTIVGVAIVIAALLVSSGPQIVSGGDDTAYVTHPDTGDLYYCRFYSCEPLVFKE